MLDVAFFCEVVSDLLRESTVVVDDEQDVIVVLSNFEQLKHKVVGLVALGKLIRKIHDGIDISVSCHVLNGHLWKKDSLVGAGIEILCGGVEKRAVPLGMVTVDGDAHIRGSLAAVVDGNVHGKRFPHHHVLRGGEFHRKIQFGSGAGIVATGNEKKDRERTKDEKKNEKTEP